MDGFIDVIISREIFLSFVDMFIISIIIAIISALFTEVVKISYEKVFVKRKPMPFFSWILNFISILILSITFIYLFNRQDNQINSIMYISIIVFLSWVLSILTYSLVIRLFIIGSNILYTRAKDYLVDSETDLISSTLLKMKQEELLDGKIALDKLKSIKGKKPHKKEK